MKYLSCGHCGEISTDKEECPFCGDSEHFVKVVLPNSKNPDRDVRWLASQLHILGTHLFVTFESPDPDNIAIRCPHSLREAVTESVTDFINIAYTPQFQIPQAARELYPKYTEMRFELIREAARACKFELNAAWLDNADDVPRDMFHFALVDRVVDEDQASTVYDVVDGVRVRLRSRLT